MLDNADVVTVPAFVWRGGPLLRGIALGSAVGGCSGILAWLDSGLAVTGLIVLVVVGPFYGVWMQRRMTRYWPGAAALTGQQRVTVARTARRGGPITDPRLAGAVIDYRRGLRACAESARPFRWVMPLVLVVAVAAALWDAVFGSWGNAVVSAIYLVALLAELLWWPTRRETILAHADRAAGYAISAPGND